MMAGKQVSLLGFLSTKASDTATGSQVLSDKDGTTSTSDSHTDQPSHINETVETCNAECCSRDKPNQPTSKHILARTKRLQGSQARYVQENWFKDHT